MFAFNYTGTIGLLLLAILIRWLVAQFPYSGFNKPPMFGDYEAQRHWMEVTTNLPVNEWYQNSTDNDLLYWGLDYPPLSAYHMFLLGHISRQINESWTELNHSRGFESHDHKIFMRYSVIISDIIFYLATIIYYFKYTQPTHYESPPSNSQKQNIAIYTALVLLYPAQILIDHGHFQYNCVFMGLTLIAIIFMEKNHQFMGAITFMLAIGYKQMSLYYSLPFFWYIASICLRQGSILKIIRRFIVMGLLVSVSACLIFLPYIKDFNKLTQVLNRIFPISRGLFEDKVGNIWFCLNIPLNLKTTYPIEYLLRLSTLSTLIASLPTGIHLLIRPSIRAFKYALVNSSLIFFLLSFQVHEKTILVPALPMLILFREHPMAVNWFVILSTFSLQPLLIKDDLLIPYQVLFTVYTLVSLEIFGRHISFNLDKMVSWRNLTFFTYICSIFGCFVLNVGAIFIEPPSVYPDIHPTLNALYSCAHFVMFLLFFSFQQFRGNHRSTLVPDRSMSAKKSN